MGKDGQIFYVLPLPEIISATDGNIVAREGSQADLFLTGSPFVDKIEINFATEAAKNWHNYTLPPKPERILKTDL